MVESLSIHGSDRKKGKSCKKMPTGTKEWADSNVNLVNGCKNDCRYCYAKKMALRFGRKTATTWKEMVINEVALHKSYLKRNGRIMFPSSHDITPEVQDACIVVLEKLLLAGNDILITSKPSFSVIKTICETFLDYQEKIQFRFTIGSKNNDILKFWEPGAPNYEERLSALRLAYYKGYRTSISIEPFLDFDPIPLVQMLQPYVTDTIWIGLMNYIVRNGLTPEEQIVYAAIRKNYEIENVYKIYGALKDNPKVRWKDSIKKMLNL